jgi:prolyl 4-hydroxylase
MTKRSRTSLLLLSATAMAGTTEAFYLHSLSIRSPSLKPTFRTIREDSKLAFQPHTRPLVSEIVTGTHSHEFWRKERTAEEVRAHVQTCLDDITQQTDDDDTRPTAHVVSSEPPLVLIHDFLSTSMCKNLIDTATSTDKMIRSTTGSEQETSTIRTSTTVWLNDEQVPETSRIIAEKISSISGFPANHMENLQVVRYETGQSFKLHTDTIDAYNEMDKRGRVATCLIYLAAPTIGGETLFPDVHADKAIQIRIAPRQGSAIFFWNTHEKPGSPAYDGADMFLNTDLRMRHAGMPVDGGEKWVCNRWVHPVDYGVGVRGL